MILKIPRLLFAAPLLGYSVSLFTWGGNPHFYFVAAAITAYATCYALPWRVPRDDRTPLGYWFEALICTLPLVAGSAACLMSGICTGSPARRVQRALLPLPAWYLVAIIAGIAIIWWSGINLRALYTGDLAFLAGLLPVHRAMARTWIVAVAVVGEEIVFRGIPRGIGTHWLPAMIVGAIAFVCSHHLVRGAADRLRWLVIRTEAGAAILFGMLVALSGSVWPAVLAHAITDVPHVMLDLQRAKGYQEDSDHVREVIAE
jgi:hypothetical protein